MSRVYIIYLRIAQASRKHLDLAHHSITLKSLISENSLQLRIPLRPWAANAEGRSRNISGQCLAKSTTSAPESCEKRVAQDCSNMSNLKRHPANLKWQNEWACCTSLHEELYTLYSHWIPSYVFSHAFHWTRVEIWAHAWKISHQDLSCYFRSFCIWRGQEEDQPAGRYSNCGSPVSVVSRDRCHLSHSAPYVSAIAWAAASWQRTNDERSKHSVENLAPLSSYVLTRPNEWHSTKHRGSALLECLAIKLPSCKQMTMQTVIRIHKVCKIRRDQQWDSTNHDSFDFNNGTS